jgi:regulator of protease activity HflC (stomatin/prohibitin superfamily)
LAWIIFIALLVPLVGIIAWIALDDSFVKVDSGQLGLLLIKGRATDTVLSPGPHWVPALRRRTVETYPSLELSYRAGAEDVGAAGTATDVERSGPALRATLSGGVGAVVSYTVRFRLDTDELRVVHERFGRDGIWGAVRDVTDQTLRSALVDTDVDDVFGVSRDALQTRLTETVKVALEPLGFVVTLVSLGAIDLGRTGETIEATSRARHELSREQAETNLRLTRVRTDVEVAAVVGDAGADAALRYRELDLWRDVGRDLRLVVPSSQSRPSPASSAPAAAAAPALPMIPVADIDQPADEPIAEP